MALLRKKYLFQRPGLVHTLKVKSYAAGATSEWSDPIDIRSSEYDRIRFGDAASLEARPRWWNRVIRVSWTPAWPTSFIREERLSHYRVFRCESTDWSTDLPLIHRDDDSPYYLSDAGRALFYIDSDITEEVSYYYWVYGVDRRGWVSDNYVGPDNAEFGEPAVPTDLEFSSEVHTNNKWWCDVEVKWNCVGGAEYYWVQRRHENNVLWGPAFYVEHDPDVVGKQSCVMDNFRTNNTYYIRIKAVNIAGVLTSEWTDDADGEFDTTYDSDPPLEVRDVEAHRQKLWGKERGDFVRITWSYPERAWYSQQVTHYNIYRHPGPDWQNSSTASELVARINNASASPVPLDQGFLFAGTQYLDDDIASAETFDYYVTAVDEYDQESPVIDGGASHDRVSFLPPEAPTDLSITTELVYAGYYGQRRYSATLEWRDVEEATHYRVYYKLKRPRVIGGTQWSRWYMFPIPQTAAEVEGDPSKAEFTIPRSLQEGVEIQAYVKAKNRAGPSGPSATVDEEVSEDNTPPSQVTGITATCLGFYPFGVRQKWGSVRLTWDRNDWDEGVDYYEISWINSRSGGYSDSHYTDLRTKHGGTRWSGGTVAYNTGPLPDPYVGPPYTGGWYLFRVRAVDKDGKTGEWGYLSQALNFSAWWEQ